MKDKIQLEAAVLNIHTQSFTVYLAGLTREFTTVEATSTPTTPAPATTPACTAGDKPSPETLGMFGAAAPGNSATTPEIAPSPSLTSSFTS